MSGPGQDPFYYQRGQAHFLVLIAIALFAALAYVVFQGQPGNRASAAEGNLRTAARVAAYPAAIQSAAKHALADGVRPEELNFQPDADGREALFSKAYGVTYRSPAAVTGAETEWSFKGISAEGRGFFISGIGTDGPAGKDVIAVLDGVPQDVCEDINQALGLPRNPLPEIPPVNLSSKGGGAKDKAGANAFSFKAYAEAPKPGACVQNGDKYVYYHVIVAK